MLPSTFHHQSRLIVHVLVSIVLVQREKTVGSGRRPGLRANDGKPTKLGHHHVIVVLRGSKSSSVRGFVPQRWGIATVDDRIRDGDGIVGEAVKLVVDLRDALLGALDVRLQVAEAVLVSCASLDAGERNDGVVENPADVRWRGRRGGAGE